MGNITLKFNNGSPLIRHSPSGDAVLVSELKLHTEYELDSLKAQLATEREAHARTLAALEGAQAWLEWEGLRAPDDVEVTDGFAAERHARATIAAAKVTP